MNNIIIPSDPRDYLLIDRFNRAGPEAHASAPTYAKNGDTWTVNVATPTGVFETSASGYLVAEVGAITPGAQDSISIDIGEAYTYAYVEFLLADTENMGVFFNTTAETRNGGTHNSHEFRVDGSTTYQTRFRDNVNGTPAFITDNGDDDGTGVDTDISTSIAVATKARALFCKKDGVLTVKMGDHVRSWAEATDMTSTLFGLTFTPNTATCFIYDVRVW